MSTTIKSKSTILLIILLLQLALSLHTAHASAGDVAFYIYDEPVPDLGGPKSSEEDKDNETLEIDPLALEAAEQANKPSTQNPSNTPRKRNVPTLTFDDRSEQDNSQQGRITSPQETSFFQLENLDNTTNVVIIFSSGVTLAGAAIFYNSSKLALLFGRL